MALHHCVHTIKHKTWADLESQETLQRKLWQLITPIIVYYLSSWPFDRLLIHQSFLSPRLCAVQYLEGFGDHITFSKVANQCQINLKVCIWQAHQPIILLASNIHLVHTMVLLYSLILRMKIFANFTVLSQTVKILMLKYLLKHIFSLRNSWIHKSFILE